MKFLFHLAHWDGWQPFGGSVRGCGAIEVSIATMSKLDRCHAKETYVAGFVPSYLLPKKRPISLDPFIEPLIRDIEDGFLNGIQVNYSQPVAGIAPGPTRIRHLLLCWEGDHPAQCEVGKFIKCGKNGCRRCRKVGTWVPHANHYYYPGFRKEARFPTERKDVLDNLQLLKEIEEEERVSVKCGRAKECGYTGLSILHRLYPLYGFKYDRDMVFDEMHTIALNVVKWQVQHLLNGETEELSTIIWEEVDRRLDKFPWTHEYKSSRLPKGIKKTFWILES